MNKECVEECLVNSLSKLEIARDHAASSGNDKAYHRLNDLCVNLSDLLDEIEDNTKIVVDNRQYTAEQAQLLLDALAQHDASTLQPAFSSENRQKLDGALASLRLELSSFIAQSCVQAANMELAQDVYDYDDLDGQ